MGKITPKEDKVELLNATYSVRTSAGYEVNMTMNRNGSVDIRTLNMQKVFQFTESDPFTVKGIGEALILASEAAAKHKGDFTPFEGMED